MTRNSPFSFLLVMGMTPGSQVCPSPITPRKSIMGSQIQRNMALNMKQKIYISIGYPWCYKHTIVGFLLDICCYGFSGVSIFIGFFYNHVYCIIYQLPVYACHVALYWILVLSIYWLSLLIIECHHWSFLLWFCSYGHLYQLPIQGFLLYFFRTPHTPIYQCLFGTIQHHIGSVLYHLLIIMTLNTGIIFLTIIFGHGIAHEHMQIKYIYGKIIY